MSFINASQLATSTPPSFDFEPQPGGMPASRARFDGDGFRSNAIAFPNASGGAIDDGLSSFGAAATNSSPGSLLANIMQSFSNALAQIVSLFGGNVGSGTPPSQTAYTNASASSTGDPHLAFNGTTTGGVAAGGKWDSMQGHADLLDSDSFRGGYRVSTTTTAPNSNGVTYNASATVAMRGGRDAVTLNQDGSYHVTHEGRELAMTAGKPVHLGRGETVTLEPDSSLTIVATSEQGSRLTTTLAKNNGGVDVNASGSNVDLGGDLVDGSTGVASRPPERTRATYGTDTEPIGAGEIEFV